MAVYLASQDNAENGLCATLKLPKTPPAAMNSLIFTPTAKQPVRIHMSSNGTASCAPSKGSGSIVPVKPATNDASPDESKDAQLQPAREEGSDMHKQETGFSITERHESKDYRSFAANMFGTVAFKMLEWLTPSGVEDMSRIAQSFRTEELYDDRTPAPRKPKLESRNRSASPTSHPTTDNEAQERKEETAPVDDGPADSARVTEPAQTPKDTRERREVDHLPLQSPSSTSARPAHPRRNSNAKVRTPGAKPKRQLSIDPFSPEASLDDPYASLLKSPRHAPQAEKNAKGLKTSGSSLSRPISQLSSAGFFDDVSLEKMPPLKSIDIKTKPSRLQTDGARSDSSSTKETQPIPGTSSESSGSPARAFDHESDSEEDSVLPQTLSKLDADIVDFICDVLQEDDTGEKHMLEPPAITKFHHKPSGHGKSLRRKARFKRPYSRRMRLEWKMFVEQSLFYVLSDPHPLVMSFVKQGQLYDSQTLWYCMLRMTRVAPSLVFHSLWVAAAGLFGPPKPLQSLRSPTAKLFPRPEQSLSNTEAGILMSICLHALVAAAPLVTDSRDLYDMSRIRSHGLSLAGSGAVARQPSALCLQYDDAFSNDLAMRLARRLFAAIITRRCFDEMRESQFGDKSEQEPDVLEVLFSQLDFLSMDAVYILDFSFPDRALHETRVPTLLLDWARAVMLNDWDGNPVVPGDGSFGGALALIEAMCRQSSVFCSALHHLLTLS